MNKKIFVGIRSMFSTGDVSGLALCEDGHAIAGHLSQSENYLKHDMGITSDWKHEYYSEHCPDGYELVWVGKDWSSPEVKAAIENNKRIHAEKETDNA